MRFSFSVLKRILSALFVLFGLSVLIFIIARILPGDPARMALGPRASEWAIERFRAEFYLNEPIYVQYFHWLYGAFTGNLGISYFTRRPILGDILLFLPATLELIGFAAFFQVTSAILLGSLAGRYAKSWVDNVVRVISYLGVAVPSFIFAIIFLLIFGYGAGIFPTTGRISMGLTLPPSVTGFLTIDSLIAGNLVVFVDAAKHLVLPALALAMGGLAQEARIIRSSMVENLNKDYVLSAISHGIPERVIMFKHLLKPSLVPAVSVMALDIAALLSGAFLVEIIFNWPGFSKYAINVMLRKDLNAIVGVVLTIGIAFTIANIVVDVVVNRLDPRIRLTKKAE